MKAVSGQECSNSLKVEISLELISYLFKTQQLHVCHEKQILVRFPN